MVTTASIYNQENLKYKLDETLGFQFKHCIVCTKNITSVWTVHQIQINMTSIQSENTVLAQLAH